MSCKYLNLCRAIALITLDLTFLGNLKVLIIWESGIRDVDLRQLDLFEVIIYGYYE